MSGCAHVPTLHLPHMKAHRMTRQPPAMLQVAHQEGHYLGKLFKKHHLIPGEGKRGIAAKPGCYCCTSMHAVGCPKKGQVTEVMLYVQTSLRASRHSSTPAMAPLPILATVQLSLTPSNRRPCWATSGAALCCIWGFGRHCTVLRPCWADHPRCVRRGWLMGLLWKSAEVFMQVCTFEAVAFSQIVHLNNNHSCFCVPLLITTCHAQISYKNMWLVSRDFLKTRLFGRDISDV